MPPIEVGPISALGALNARMARKAGGEEHSAVRAASDAAKPARTSSPNVEIASASAGSGAPVDSDRVSMIRKAIEDGHYPLVPAKIADAMIAAGVMLRSAK
jgi:negative regulator of flagellin synthesis FlgM